MVLLATACVYAAWAWYAQRQTAPAMSAVQAAYESAVAAAEPTVPEETPSASAALDRALRDYDSSVKVPDAKYSLPLSDDARTAWTIYVIAQAPALTALEDVAPGAHPRVHLPGLDPQTATPGLTPWLSGMGTTRSLAMLLRADASLALDKHDSARYAKRLEQLEAISDAFGVSRILVVALVQDALASMGPAAVADGAPDLAIGGEPGAAQRGAILQLIHTYLDDRPLKAGMRAAMCGTAIRSMRLPSWAGFPPLILGRARVANAYVACGDLAMLATWPETHAGAPPRPQVHGLAREFGQLLEALNWPSDRALLMPHRAMLDRHVAAVMLALRLYETDHGQRPESLSSLVPDYLPFVPEDNFDHGHPLHYLPHAAQPCLYSVGEDGHDDGGSVQSANSVVPTRYGRDWYRWQNQDVVYFLDRPTYPPDPTPPTTGSALTPEERATVRAALEKAGIAVPPDLLPETAASQRADDHHPEEGQQGNQQKR
jgi:hypothetical protein